MGEKLERNVSVATSFFLLSRALFTSGWNNTEKKVYNIPGISPDMMKLIIEYAYTRTIPITPDNVEKLLAAADQFNIMGIVRGCCEFLKSELCLDNCIGICKFTDYYYCPELRQKAYMFILHNFEEMVKVSAEFLELSVSELKDIIEKDELNVKQEDAVFEAILKWISHDPQNRKQHISVLLPKVKFSYFFVGCLLAHVWFIYPGGTVQRATFRCFADSGAVFTHTYIEGHLLLFCGIVQFSLLLALLVPSVIFFDQNSPW